MKQATAVEIIITYISLGWAFVFLTDNKLFDHSKNFSTIKEIVQYEWVLGTVALIIALVTVVGMALNFTKLRRFGLILSALFWGIIAAAMLVASGSLNFSSGFVAYSGLAVLCFWTSREVTTNDRMG